MLAWLGGGSLVSGGFGIAGGQLVAAVSEVVRTPILTPDNQLTSESAEMNLRFRHIMGDA